MQEEERADLDQDWPAGDQTPSEASDSEQSGQPESRVGKFLRRSLRWVAAFAAVFAVGVLVIFFVRVRPQADQLRSFQRQLDESRNQVSNLQARLDQLEPLQTENEQLVQQLAESERHLDLLSVLVDVTNAQLDLAQDQPEAAMAALEDTDDKLESLLAGVDGSDAESVQAMRSRLELVLEGLEGDVFAAQRDLEIMANNLVDLERRIFP